MSAVGLSVVRTIRDTGRVTPVGRPPALDGSAGGTADAGGTGGIAVGQRREAGHGEDPAQGVGCRFALDDFGAGFGSFYYLKHLEFDYVKIDGEFVAKSPSNPADRLIITSIVDIAHGLGKRTVAEFVSDPEILTTVAALGVDRAQGYHIGRPTPVEFLIDQLQAAARSHV